MSLWDGGDETLDKITLSQSPVPVREGVGPDSLSRVRTPVQEKNVGLRDPFRPDIKTSMSSPPSAQGEVLPKNPKTHAILTKSSKGSRISDRV